MAKTPHKWSLVGPWYRRHSLGGGVAEHSSRPILQKYAGSNFVSELLHEPQRSLKFVGEDFAKLRTMSLEQPIKPGEQGVGNPIKLYLDSHDRFYVVVCELHCQLPGFPTVDRSKVTEAGFVVRKRVTARTDMLPQQTGGKKRTGADLQQKRVITQQQAQALKEKAARPGVAGFIYQRAAEKKNQQSKILQRVVQQNELFEIVDAIGANNGPTTRFGWCDNHSVAPQLDANAPTVWNWSALEGEEPQQLVEARYPLYPLIPDPKEKQHSASGKSLWYGVVPTFSADVDETGAPRFDDSSAYELRCYVKRHRDCCKKPQVDGSCCRGELVWSEPTEPYRLAPFFDLYGSGHKPINIKLPDLDKLKKQVLAAPPGKGTNVRMETPPNSGFSFNSASPMAAPGSGSTSGSGAICFLAWPIFTFVAMFLFQLILPVLLFLFQLWFLLSLRLCIPPSIKIDAGFAADLKLQGPDFNFAAKFSADFKLGGFGPIKNFSDLKAAFAAKFDTGHDLDGYMRDELLANIGRGENIQAIAQAVVNLSSAYSDDPNEPTPAETMPKASDGLYYFKRKEPSA